MFKLIFNIIMLSSLVLSLKYYPMYGIKFKKFMENGLAMFVFGNDDDNG